MGQVERSERCYGAKVDVHPNVALLCPISCDELRNLGDDGQVLGGRPENLAGGGRIVESHAKADRYNDHENDFKPGC